MALAWPRLNVASQRYPWYVLGTVCLGTTMGAFDFGAINAAYPSLADAFGTPVAVVSWLGIAYSLVSASLLAVFGRLADIVGQKRIYLSGFVVYLIGSAVAILAPGFGWLIAARAISGVGSAMLVANSIAIIGAHFPSHRRGTAIGSIETAVAVGMALGPTLGGILAESFGWRSIFLGAWPPALLGLALASVVLRDPPRRTRRERFDFLGAVLFGFGTLCALLGLTLGATTGWHSPTVLVAFGVAALLLPAFVLVESRVPSPMIDLELFRHPVFAAANLAKVCCYLSLFCAVFLAPFYLQRLLDFAPAQVGLALTPIPLALSVSALCSGTLSDRVGTRLLSAGGMLLGALGALLMTTLQPAAGYPALLLALMVIVFGLGAFIAPNDSAIIGAAPRDRLGVASGILALTRNIGMILGLAVAGSLLSAREALYLVEGLGERAAFLEAFHDVFRAAVVLCLVGAALSLARARER